jgi:hypothetical protein
MLKSLLGLSSYQQHACISNIVDIKHHQML